jgi:hypothetical protein
MQQHKIARAAIGNLGRVIAILLGVLLSWLALVVVLRGVLHLPPAFIVAGPVGMFAWIISAIVYLNIPGRLHVGVDGVLVDKRDSRRYVRFAEMKGVEKYKDMTMGKTIIGVLLHLVGGETIKVPYGEDQFGADRKVHALHMDIEAALDAYRQRAPGAALVTLDRGDRTTEAWMQRLRGIGMGANASPREAPVTQDGLWRVVEDPTVKAEARAAAAAALAPSLDDQGKARLRVAAESTAAPRLRVAFESAAASDEASMAAALEAVEKEG